MLQSRQVGANFGKNVIKPVWIIFNEIFFGKHKIM